MELPHARFRARPHEQRAPRALRLYWGGMVATWLLRAVRAHDISPYLPISPHISPYLPISLSTTPRSRRPRPRRVLPWLPVQRALLVTNPAGGGVGHGLRCAGGVPSSVRPLHSTMPLYLFNEAAPPCPPEEAVHKLTQLSHEDPNLAMFPS